MASSECNGWARALRDRCRWQWGAQLVLAEHPVEYVEDERVRRQAVEGAGLGEEGVDASGVAPFEVVAARRCLVNDALQRVACPADVFGADGVRQDRIPVGFQCGQDVVHRVSSLRECRSP